ncbi:hypothetical protein AVEN_186127-1, partial [Araneus ventricosus]
SDGSSHAVANQNSSIGIDCVHEKQKVIHQVVSCEYITPVTVSVISRIQSVGLEEDLNIQWSLPITK